MSNIYEVIREHDMDILFNIKSQNRLLIILYTRQNSNKCNEFRKDFIKIANRFKGCLFINICIDKFESQTNRYTGLVKNITYPYVILFYNKNILSVIEGNSSELIDKIIDIQSYISEQLARQHNKSLEQDNKVVIEHDIKKNVKDR